MNKYLKRIMVVVLTFTVLFPFTLPKVQAASVQFPDVDPGYWAFDEIHYLAEQEIIRGYKNGNFGPNNTLKRMQAAEMLVKALNLSTENRPNPNFKDIQPGDYGYEYAATLADEGIMTGSNGYFKPWEPLTRAQMAKILTVAYDLDYFFGASFIDIPEDFWAYDYIASLEDNFITTGYDDGTFRPNNFITRAQFSAFMARTLSDTFKKAILIYPGVYWYEEDGGLTLTADFTNNFDEPAQLVFSVIVVTKDGEVVADGFFDFTEGEDILQPKETVTFTLTFDSEFTYQQVDLNQLKLYYFTYHE
jgi:S-layer homology domain